MLCRRAQLTIDVENNSAFVALLKAWQNITVALATAAFRVFWNVRVTPKKKLVLASPCR